MNKTLWIASALSTAAVLVAPTSAAAHQGHAGDHGWLWGALQPLLSLDHLLAGLSVLAVGAVAFALLGRLAGGRARVRRVDPPR